MIDPFTQDPVFDPAFPPKTSDIHFRSQGALLNGVILTAGGADPKPTALLLHGFPGNERNFDLAHLYRRAGFNTVVFHYRGAWGSEGSFSFGNCFADVSAALEFLRENATQYGIDPQRMALVGHSMGGWIALIHTARSLGIGVKAAISICGFNFGRFALSILNDDAKISAWEKAFDEEILPLSGTSGKALIEEVLHAGPNWDLCDYAFRLGNFSVMLIGAQQDTIATLEESHQPLANLMPYAEKIIYDTDHSLASHRVALARDTLAFLRKALK